MKHAKKVYVAILVSGVVLFLVSVGLALRSKSKENMGGGGITVGDLSSGANSSSATTAATLATSKAQVERVKGSIFSRFKNSRVLVVSAAIVAVVVMAAILVPVIMISIGSADQMISQDDESISQGSLNDQGKAGDSEQNSSTGESGGQIKAQEKSVWENNWVLIVFGVLLIAVACAIIGIAAHKFYHKCDDQEMELFMKDIRKNEGSNGDKPIGEQGNRPVQKEGSTSSTGSQQGLEEKGFPQNNGNKGLEEDLDQDSTKNSDSDSKTQKKDLIQGSTDKTASDGLGQGNNTIDETEGNSVESPDDDSFFTPDNSDEETIVPT